jgi:hypothetical protein
MIGAPIIVIGYILIVVGVLFAIPCLLLQRTTKRMLRLKVIGENDLDMTRLYNDTTSNDSSSNNGQSITEMQIGELQTGNSDDTMGGQEGGEWQGRALDMEHRMKRISKTMEANLRLDMRDEIDTMKYDLSSKLLRIENMFKDYMYNGSSTGDKNDRRFYRSGGRRRDGGESPDSPINLKSQLSGHMRSDSHEYDIGHHRERERESVRRSLSGMSNADVSPHARPISPSRTIPIATTGSSSNKVNSNMRNSPSPLIHNTGSSDRISTIKQSRSQSPKSYIDGLTSNPNTPTVHAEFNTSPSVSRDHMEEAQGQASGGRGRERDRTSSVSSVPRNNMGTPTVHTEFTHTSSKLVNQMSSRDRATGEADPSTIFVGPSGSLSSSERERESNVRFTHGTSGGSRVGQVPVDPSLLRIASRDESEDAGLSRIGSSDGSPTALSRPAQGYGSRRGGV